MAKFPVKGGHYRLENWVVFDDDRDEGVENYPAKLWYYSDAPQELLKDFSFEMGRDDKQIRSHEEAFEAAVEHIQKCGDTVTRVIWSENAYTYTSLPGSTELIEEDEE